ncbi:hypothetical protein [Streptomyces lincolnensis]|uniref:hypothetical protein n=1 Tax=Streptomyces lincolnensis TaxID=1915 RepID=UPI0037CE3E0C
MMTALRKTAARFGTELLALAKVAVVLVVAGIVAAVSYTPLRKSLSEHDSRIAGAVLAVILAVGVYQFLDWVTDPISKHLTDASYDWSSRRGNNSEAPAATLKDGIAQVAAGAAEDAAARAAHSVRVKLDLSATSVFANEDRWQGYENGEARLFIAPGATLYFRELEDSRLGIPVKEFTLLTADSDDDSVQITSLAQLHQHLTARDAGLPVAPPVDDTDDGNDGDWNSLSPAA